MKRLIRWAGIWAVSFLLLTACQKSDANRDTYRMTGIEQLNSGDFAGAISSLDMALEKSDGWVGTFELDVLKYRAEAEYQLEDYVAAAHTYDVLLQVDKERPEYLNLRCMALTGQGKLKEAMDDFTKAYAMDPKAPGMEKAMVHLTSELENSADYRSEAMDIYRKMLEDGVSNAQVFNRMGIYELEEKNYSQALSYFEQGIATGDENVKPLLLCNEAAVYEQQGDFPKALELLQGYINAYGTDAQVEREIAFLKTR